MKVIKQNVECGLLNTIKTYWENDEPERCLHLKSSQLNLKSEEEFLIITTKIEEFFNDQIGYIFLCNDFDVFILSRHLTNKVLTSLLSHLDIELVPVPVNKELAFLFEISVSWVELKKICEKKIEVIKLDKLKAQKEKELKKLEEEKLKIVNHEVSKDLVSTLPFRRNKRSISSILVVEDDIFSSRLVKNTINKEHYVTTAKDGKEAIAFYAKEAPDILFLDIGLPDIDGHELLKKIFEIDENAYVVMLSGNGDRKNVMRAIEQGAKGFIGKPFTKDKLFQYISKSPFIQQKQGV